MDNFDLSNYDVIPPHVFTASTMVTQMWDRLGRPKTPLSDQGEKLVNFMFEIWKEYQPYEYTRWIEMRKEHKKEEKTISEQVSKHTGRSLASYPMLIFRMMKVCFPDFDPVKRENCLKMVRKFPMFSLPNKI